MTVKTKETTRPLTATERLDDEFYYGYRTIITYDKQGKEIYSYKPLTLDDFLDPEEGDLFMQGTLHNEDTDALKSIFRYLYQNGPDTAVFSDLKVLWGIEGLSQPAPDVMVVPNVQNPAQPRPAFDVSEEGVRPTFILEVVSPRYRQPDRDKKVAIYEQAGVQEYFIIDSWLQGEQISYEVLGYRLQDGIYTQIQPNEQGWVFSEVNNVWLGVSEDKKRFFVIDGQTGERILTAEERAAAEAAARQQAEARIAQLEMQLQELKARYQANDTSGGGKEPS
jgi:Uma2 family endonuclease